ncbi:MAG: hypothetical protein LBQ05_01915 [Christensenellaceae bacterium]|jgi:hypothetical protein|nr:hypothetical protein [Christensenellaceae bacterium]
MEDRKNKLAGPFAVGALIAALSGGVTTGLDKAYEVWSGNADMSPAQQELAYEKAYRKAVANDNIKEMIENPQVFIDETGLDPMYILDYIKGNYSLADADEEWGEDSVFYGNDRHGEYERIADANVEMQRVKQDDPIRQRLLAISQTALGAVAGATIGGVATLLGALGLSKAVGRKKEQNGKDEVKKQQDGLER